MSYTYEYPRPAVTVDIVLFGVGPATAPDAEPAALQVLLVERANDPCRGMSALPGGYVEVSDDGDQGEDLETAARRELLEETGVQVGALEQLCAVGTPGRNARSRVITVVYTAVVRVVDHPAVAGSDAARARWVDARRALTQPEGLAFDHAAILRTALARVQREAT